MEDGISMTLYEKLRTKTIVLLDTDPWIRDSLSLLFQCEVCRFLPFDNVADGIRAVETDRCDIIICDYGMPGMDGVTFLREAGRFQPGAIRILIAGYPVGEMADIASRAGIHDCLQKPFTLDALETMLGGLIDKIPAEIGQSAENRAG